MPTLTFRERKLPVGPSPNIIQSFNNIEIAFDFLEIYVQRKTKKQPNTTCIKQNILKNKNENNQKTNKQKKQHEQQQQKNVNNKTN